MYKCLYYIDIMYLNGTLDRYKNIYLHLGLVHLLFYKFIFFSSSQQEPDSFWFWKKHITLLHHHHHHVCHPCTNKYGDQYYQSVRIYKNDCVQRLRVVNVYTHTEVVKILIKKGEFFVICVFMFSFRCCCCFWWIINGWNTENFKGISIYV